MAAIQWHVNRRSPVRNPEGCNLSWESWPWCCNLTALPQYSPLDRLVHAVRLRSNSYKGFGRGFISWLHDVFENSKIVYIVIAKKTSHDSKVSMYLKKHWRFPKKGVPPNHPNLDYSTVVYSSIVSHGLGDPPLKETLKNYYWCTSTRCARASWQKNAFTKHPVCEKTQIVY